MCSGSSTRARCPVPSVSPPSSQDGAGGGRISPTVRVVAEDGEAEGEEEEGSRRSGQSFLESSTLFVNGMSEMVGYPQIRAMFAQIGGLGIVFVQ